MEWSNFLMTIRCTTFIQKFKTGACHVHECLKQAHKRFQVHSGESHLKYLWLYVAVLFILTDTWLCKYQILLQNMPNTYNYHNTLKGLMKNAMLVLSYSQFLTVFHAMWNLSLISSKTWTPEAIGILHEFLCWRFYFLKMRSLVFHTVLWTQKVFFFPIESYFFLLL